MQCPSLGVEGQNVTHTHAMKVCAGLKNDGGDARSAAWMHLKYSENFKKQLCEATLFTEVKNTGTHQEIGSFFKGFI